MRSQSEGPGTQPDFKKMSFTSESRNKMPSLGSDQGLPQFCAGVTALDSTSDPQLVASAASEHTLTNSLVVANNTRLPPSPMGKSGTHPKVDPVTVQSGPLEMYRGSLRNGILVDGNDWTKEPDCGLTRQTFHVGNLTILNREIERVERPLEYGEFVFQLYLNDGDIVTLRAPTYTAMVDWCEALWEMERSGKRKSLSTVCVLASSFQS